MPFGVPEKKPGRGLPLEGAGRPSWKRLMRFAAVYLIGLALTAVVALILRALIGS